jgi:N-acetyl-gamma-glutamylphosphate reductase
MAPFIEQIVRLLTNHPHFAITVMTADRKAGQPFGSVFPHLIAQVSLKKYFFVIFASLLLDVSGHRYKFLRALC